ncbi:hypothetical protein [Sinorhizobium alkalisoli]|uniref:Uncharacterized protein n=1 Tax=Sinorhizobium alkalisoli TaxID=1752398 RepID=A0A1E3VHU9_9HYPH|nr:hypothetical protein [Sinorhizobium alkalisoli]MCA1491834.1 hypothetical protein [Ensifer sp. NBAIM29]MCG5480296.1 hypothetical protein [Sinorhizobium alkalisoli]ODR92436.1 hypothetical protein A8M32_05235 [Sinorhizobium alkalisoli]QFI66864.1 hypothetical protein EKH55_1990 [Sinorhizobium alkalisoli]
MSADNKPDATIKVEKRLNGRWAFVLTYRGVTYPAHGQFGSQVEAQAAALAASKLLRKNG